jgi:Fanconi anemia group J protein
VLSRVVSTGLDGRKLRATFKEADQLDYQDSLGQLLLGVAHTVPDGVLMFLPSYALMEKLTKRWQVGQGASRGRNKKGSHAMAAV